MIRTYLSSNTMKFIAVFLVLSSVIGTAGSVLAENWLPEKPDNMPDISVSTSFLTKYIWRGQNLGNEPVMQFDGSLSKNGLTLDVWGNYSTSRDKTTDSGRYQELTELDYTVKYNLDAGEAVKSMGMESAGILDQLGVSAGYTFYTFPNLDFTKNKLALSHEIFVGASYDVILQPFITWYNDVDAGSGSYIQFGGSHGFDLSNGISAGVSTSFGYNYHQYTPKKGWSDALISGNVSIPVFNYFTVTPNVGYSIILDRDTYEQAQSNEFYGGISVSFSY